MLAAMAMVVLASGSMPAAEIPDGSVPLDATVRYVSGEGSNLAPYDSWETAASRIQDAIDLCDAGDVTMIGDGVYSTETGEVFPIVVPDGVMLRSANGARSVIIDAGETGTVIETASETPALTMIIGLTVTGGSALASQACGIRATGGNVLILDCVVDGNDRGIWVSGGKTNAVAGTVISGNTADGCYASGDGVNLKLYGCSFLANGGHGGVSVAGAICTARKLVSAWNGGDGVIAGDASGGARWILDNATIYGNAESGVRVRNRSSANLNSSIVWGNITGSIIFEDLSTCGAIFSDIEGGYPGYFNIDLDPAFRGIAPVTPSGLRLTSLSPCINTGDPALGRDPDGTTVDMGAFPYAFLTISVIDDVPTDEGGHVVIEWRGCHEDDEEGTNITEYEIWRRTEADGEADAGGDGAEGYPDGDGAEGHSDGDGGGGVEAPAGSPEVLTLPPGGWELVTGVPATGQEVYQAIVPTVADSTEAGGMVWTSFLVVGCTDGASLYYISDIGTGYSVDNTAPEAPFGLEGSPAGPEGGLALAWSPSGSPDVSFYELHRSTPDGSGPDASDLLYSGSGLSFVDATGDVFGECVYRVVAVDSGGNTSECSLWSPSTTGIDAGGWSAAGVSRSYPNPFRPATEATRIGYALASPGTVTVSVFDASGHLVKVVESAPKNVGSHTAVWNGTDNGGRRVASGIYFCRVELPGATEVRKIVLLE
jgi:hypothetical protein